MNNKIGIALACMLIMLSMGFSSQSGAFTCQFIDSSQFSSVTGQNEDIAFYSSKDLETGSVLNAKVSIHEKVGNTIYPYGLHCSSNIEMINISFTTSTKEECEDSGGHIFGYLESETNSKLSLQYNSNYNITICLQPHELIEDLDLKVASVDEGFSFAGYECIYRFGSGYSESNANGKVSLCEADFSSFSQYSQYPFAVYAKLIKNANAILCNSDCASAIDGRIYQACALKVDQCKNIPLACDGSLKGSWVRENPTTEVRCELPFDQRRTRAVSKGLTVEYDKEDCKDVIVNKYSVLLNQEAVTMNIYICSN